MKKMFIIVFLLCFLSVIGVYGEYSGETLENEIHNAFEGYDLSEINSIGRENGIDTEEIAESAAEGKFSIDFNGVISFAANKLFSEVLLQSDIMKTIFCLCILCGVLKFIASSFFGGASELSFYICFIAAMACITLSFASAGEIVINASGELENTLSASVPLICGAVAASGGMGAAAVMLPVSAIITETAIKLTEIFFVPMINVCGGIAIVNYFSNKPILTKLSDFLALVISWTLKGFMFLSLGVLGIYRIGNVTASQTAMKIIKAGAGAVPVIGDILSGSVQTVAVFGGLVKNGIGTAAAILITVCAFVPFMKILAIVIAYKITAAIIQPMGEKAVTECVDCAGNIISLYLGVMIMMIVIFISTVLIFISISGG